MKTSFRNDINVPNINIRVNIDVDIYQYSTHTIEPWLHHSTSLVNIYNYKIVDCQKKTVTMVISCRNRASHCKTKPFFNSEIFDRRLDFDFDRKSQSFSESDKPSREVGTQGGWRL